MNKDVPGFIFNVLYNNYLCYGMIFTCITKKCTDDKKLL